MVATDFISNPLSMDRRARNARPSAIEPVKRAMVTAICVAMRTALALVCRAPGVLLRAAATTPARLA
jgi:hypothetical protein